MADKEKLIQSTEAESEQIDDRIFFGLMEKVGTKGRYQVISVVLMCIIGYICGGLMLIPPYLFYQDPYVCPQTVKGSCFVHVCGLDPPQRLPYVPEPSILTIGNKFGDFRCDDQKIKIDFVITMMYVGNVVGFLGITLIGDLVGRKMLLVGNLVLALAGLIVTLLCVSLIMAGVGLFLVCCGVQNAFNVCFYFISETMSEEYRQKFSVAIQLFYGMGVLMNVLWFWSVGDWLFILIGFYMIPLILVILATIFFMRDTPMCLVMRRKPNKAFKAFRFISKVNKKSFHVKVQDIAQIKAEYSLKLQGQCNDKKKTFTVLDLFKYKSLRMMTIILILLQCTIIFEFYAPALMLDQFKLSIYINGLVVGVSEIISYPICYYMITRIGRKPVAYGCFIATFICSVVLIFLWKQGDTDQTVNIRSSIGVLIFIFIFRFAISIQYTYFYVYFNELYPTQIRVLGTGIVSLMGGVMVTLAPIIIQSCIHSGFPIMILFAILSALSGLCSTRLPEMLGAPPHDEIKELREMKVVVSHDKVEELIKEEHLSEDQDEEDVVDEIGQSLISSQVEEESQKKS